MDERKLLMIIGTVIVTIGIIWIWVIIGTIGITDIIETTTTEENTNITVTGQVFFDNPYSLIGILDITDFPAGDGVTIIVCNQNREIVRRVTPDEHGQYSFDIPIGNYYINAVKQPHITTAYPCTNFFGPHDREINIENHERDIILGPTIFCY